MKPEYLSLLRCPKTGRRLEISISEERGGRIKTGELLEPESNQSYPIINFIPRFVPLENYSANFGLQWNVHNRTQYDETSKYMWSKERFQKSTQWPEDLTGEVILEIGSGSGRFTTPAAETGATVVTFDYSNAVEANYKSNGHGDNVLILQASVFEMPFARNFFDRAFCFGVLQHTPDPEAAFLAIPEFVKPGGEISTDVYIKSLSHWLFMTKYYVRPFTRGKAPEKLYPKIKKYVDFMWPLARLIRKIPKIGYAINWRLLVADYSPMLPGASDEQLKEWAYLDTFDMLGPMYDFPQTFRTYQKWHREAGLRSIKVEHFGSGLLGRAVKPAAEI